MKLTFTDAELKRSRSLAVISPDFDSRSGGVRALFALAATLHARGFRASLAVPRPPAGATHGVPIISHAQVLRDVPDIAIYPEVIKENELRSPHVVRFLLNKPGVAGPEVVDTFGPDDFFIHFDKSHVPEGRASQDLYTPVVDRRYYHRNGEAAERAGFVICTKRIPSRALELPSWVQPLHLVAAHRQMSHADLGDLYRRTRAFVAFERTSAIYEALCCGCPVICMERGAFQQATFQPRFGGAGMSWNFSPEGIEEAASTIDQFNAIYRDIERGYPSRVEAVFLNILREAAAREALMGKR